MALSEELNRQGEFLFRHRSNLPLVLIIAGVAVKWWTLQSVAPGYDGMPDGLLLTALGVGLLGLGIRALTVGYTPHNTSGRNTGKQVADELNRTGAYSLIRNPLYLGNYLMWVAPALLTGNGWFVLLFSLLFWIYYERIVYAEESFLRQKFGETYLTWAENIPPFLPKSFRWEKPELPFSWRKVLKKEKNGLVALFVMLYLFQVLEVSLLTERILFPQGWLLWTTIASGVIYLALRTIKKSTNLLDEEGR